MGVEMRSNNLHTIGRRLLVGFDYIWSAGLLFCRVHFKSHGFLANTKTDTRNRIYIYTRQCKMRFIYDKKIIMYYPRSLKITMAWHIGSRRSSIGDTPSHSRTHTHKQIDGVDETTRAVPDQPISTAEQMNEIEFTVCVREFIVLRQHTASQNSKNSQYNWACGSVSARASEIENRFDWKYNRLRFFRCIYAPRARARVCCFYTARTYCHLESNKFSAWL